MNHELLSQLFRVIQVDEAFLRNAPYDEVKAWLPEDDILGSSKLDH